MEIILSFILVLTFAVCVVLTIKMIYHMWYVITNITGKYSSFLVPFILFMPSQFNSLGNKHRLALLPTIFGISVCWLILVYFGVVKI